MNTEMILAVAALILAVVTLLQAVLFRRLQRHLNRLQGEHRTLVKETRQAFTAWGNTVVTRHTPWLIRDDDSSEKL